MKARSRPVAARRRGARDTHAPRRRISKLESEVRALLAERERLEIAPPRVVGWRRVATVGALVALPWLVIAGLAAAIVLFVSEV